MKNVVYFKDGIVEVKNLYSDKTASAGRKAYNAVCRAGKAGYVARYCDPDKVEATKAEVLALATGAKPTPAPVVAAKAEPSPVAKADTSRFGAIYLDWHMRDNVKRSKRYASWAEASEAYKHRAADVVSATALYQTVTVKVGESEYTYFSDYGYHPGTAVVVDLPQLGESVVEVVSSAVMSKKDLENRCSFDRFKHIVRKATKRDLEIPNDAETSRDMAEAFAQPKPPTVYGYSTFSDDDVPW